MVVASKPFTGKAGQDPEVCLGHFERYANFRRLPTSERLELMGMLMHEESRLADHPSNGR